MCSSYHIRYSWVSHGKPPFRSIFPCIFPPSRGAHALPRQDACSSEEFAGNAYEGAVMRRSHTRARNAVDLAQISPEAPILVSRPLYSAIYRSKTNSRAINVHEKRRQPKKVKSNFASISTPRFLAGQHHHHPAPPNVFSLSKLYRRRLSFPRWNHGGRTIFARRLDGQCASYAAESALCKASSPNFSAESQLSYYRRCT